MPKKPFSGKAKKQQLQQKRQSKIKLPSDAHGRGLAANLLTARQDDIGDKPMVEKINAQPKIRGGRGKPNRYVLQFHRENEEELKKRKELARQELKHLPEESLEINLDDYFEPPLEFPKRPPWNFEMSREQLEAREHRYFTEYISTLEKLYDFSTLSYFELNLETWRQLWRVLEMSDIILVIVDIRYPALMFPPSLYPYVKEVLKKDMILILNKIDLAPAPLVVAWFHYFKQKYPELHVLSFTSFPEYNMRDQKTSNSGLQNQRRKVKLRMASEGAEKLLETCKKIVGEEIDLSSWQNKIIETMKHFSEKEHSDADVVEAVKNVDTAYEEHVRFRNNILTIGCVGQPNVGKSSLLNSIMGKKVVSVSKTPGHTKHFQTIFITNNVRLCDCPGLVFPSKVPKSLQVLMGSYPIAQLREPFSVVMYLAERLDLVKMLKLEHPEGDSTWSAMDICDGWALKRGFRTAKANRLDSYRAANHILRMALIGKIPLCLRPPNYTQQKEYWQDHKEVQLVMYIQARKGLPDLPESVNTLDEMSSSEEEVEEELKEESDVSSDHSSNSDEEDMVVDNKFNLLANLD